MRKILFFFMTLIMPLVAISQERFYNLYEGWKINEIVIRNDLYYAFGSEMHPSTLGNLPQFNIIHKSGTLLDAFTFYSDTIDGIDIYNTNSRLTIGDTAVFVGTYTDSYKAWALEPIMMRYNLGTRNMDTLISYNHCVQTSNPQKARLFLVDTTETGFIITGDYSYNGQNSFPLVIFTNRAGDTLGVKQYPFLPANPYRRRVFPYQTIAVPAGGYLMSCQDEIGPVDIWPQRQRAWFVRLDSAGNELWRRTTATQDTICYHPFAFVMPDGDYLITWSDNDLYHANNNNRSIWLARMDNNGNISQKRKIQDYI